MHLNFSFEGRPGLILVKINLEAFELFVARPVELFRLLSRSFVHWLTRLERLCHASRLTIPKKPFHLQAIVDRLMTVRLIRGPLNRGVQQLCGCQFVSTVCNASPCHDFVQVFLPISFEGHRHFWRDRLNQLFILLFSLLAADVLVNTAWLYTDVRLLDKLVAVRLAPYLRYLAGSLGGFWRP